MLHVFKPRRRSVVFGFDGRRIILTFQSQSRCVKLLAHANAKSSNHIAAQQAHQGHGLSPFDSQSATHFARALCAALGSWSEVMSDNWPEFASYSDTASAEVVAGLLRSEGVPVRVSTDQPIPGLIKSVRLFVPADLMHRAKWVTSQAQLTDAELTYLATGKLEANKGDGE